MAVLPTGTHMNRRALMNRKIFLGVAAVVIAVFALAYLRSNGPQGSAPDNATIAQGGPIVTVALPTELSSDDAKYHHQDDQA